MGLDWAWVPVGSGGGPLRGDRHVLALSLFSVSLWPMGPEGLDLPMGEPRGPDSFGSYDIWALGYKV